MFLAGLCVLLIFGGLKIFDTVSKDYTALSKLLETELQSAHLENMEHIGEDPVLQSRIKKYALEQWLSLLIYDQNESLLLSLLRD